MRKFFRSRALAQSALDTSGNFEQVCQGLLNGKNTLRIRIHASHAFTGFGRLLEAQFKYDCEQNEFVRI